MQKWEYAQITFLFQSASNTATVDTVYMTATGQTLKNHEPPNINSAIAQLGLEGWEMINATETLFHNGTTTIYYFKRAITKPSQLEEKSK